MANLLRNKWIGTDQVDGRNILLKNAQFVRVEKADGSVVNLFSMSASDELVYEQAPVLSSSATESTNPLALQTKGQVDTLVQTETTNRNAAIFAEEQLRVAADDALGLRIDSAETAISDEATARADADTALGAADTALGARIDQEIIDRGDAVLAEETARIAGDNNLNLRVTDVEGRISDEETRALAAEALLIPLAEKGVADGVATLDSAGKVPSAQLPSFVDDVIEVADFASLPATGETSKIYVTIDDSKVFRWSGTVYSEVSPSEVKSVNGKVGLVVLNSDDLLEGSTNLYYTDARVNALLDPRLDAMDTSIADNATKIDTLQSDFDGEVARSDVEYARIDAAILEEKNRAIAAEQSIEGRLDSIEGVQAPVWAALFKQAITATEVSNGYVDLPYLAVENSLHVSVDRLQIYEGEDFSVSEVGGVTRITFLVIPPLESGDNLYVKGQYVPTV